MRIRNIIYSKLGQLIAEKWQDMTLFCMISRDTRWGHKFGAFGQGSLIAFPQGAIYNERAISIGENTMIGPNTTLSVGIAPGQELLADIILRIGSRCLVGRNTNIVSHFHVELDDDVIMGPNVYITDQNHGYENPSEPIWKQAPKDAGVYIGKGCWIGAGAIILPGTYIGENSVVGANSVVKGEVPPRSVVAGVPAVVKRIYSENVGWVKPD